MVAHYHHRLQQPARLKNITSRTVKAGARKLLLFKFFEMKIIITCIVCLALLSSCKTVKWSRLSDCQKAYYYRSLVPKNHARW